MAESKADAIALEEPDSQEKDAQSSFRGRLWTLEHENAKFQKLDTAKFSLVEIKNNWIKNEAYGVKLIELDDKILIIYRADNTTKLGQICKNDRGGDDRLRDLMRGSFLSFISTEMVCNEVFTNLIDIELIEVNGKRLLMGLFTTSSKSLPGKIV